MDDGKLNLVQKTTVVFERIEENKNIEVKGGNVSTSINFFDYLFLNRTNFSHKIIIIVIYFFRKYLLLVYFNNNKKSRKKSGLQYCMVSMENI